LDKDGEEATSPGSISISKSMRDSMSESDNNIFGGACHSFREKEICDIGFDMGLCSMYQTII
jgi:hypothetical protein